jgi:3-methyladenine DNA glycosylase AlkD
MKKASDPTEPLAQQVASVLEAMRLLGNPAEVEERKRFAIVSEKAFGLRVPQVRQLAKEVGRNHQLALALWKTGYHEAQLLASMIADPKQVTPALVDTWTHEFASWDVCDQCVGNLFQKLPFAEEKMMEYSTAQEEFVKRTAFSLMAMMAVHHKKSPDSRFIAWLPILEREAWDGRNFVKKAINWALRQIGKRNPQLCAQALACAERIHAQGTASAKWIASDAIRELERRHQP